MTPWNFMPLDSSGFRADPSAEVQARIAGAEMLTRPINAAFQQIMDARMQERRLAQQAAMQEDQQVFEAQAQGEYLQNQRLLQAMQSESEMKRLQEKYRLDREEERLRAEKIAAARAKLYDGEGVKAGGGSGASDGSGGSDVKLGAESILPAFGNVVSGMTNPTDVSQLGDDYAMERERRAKRAEDAAKAQAAAQATAIAVQTINEAPDLTVDDRKRLIGQVRSGNADDALNELNDMQAKRAEAAAKAEAKASEDYEIRLGTALAGMPQEYRNGGMIEQAPPKVRAAVELAAQQIAAKLVFGEEKNLSAMDRANLLEKNPEFKGLWERTLSEQRSIIWQRGGWETAQERSLRLEADEGAFDPVHQGITPPSTAKPQAETIPASGSQDGGEVPRPLASAPFVPPQVRWAAAQMAQAGDIAGALALLQKHREAIMAPAAAPAATPEPWQRVLGAGGR